MYHPHNCKPIKCEKKYYILNYIRIGNSEGLMKIGYITVRIL